MAIEEAMLVEMFKTQAKMEVKLDQLIAANQMEEMEDMMEEAQKKSKHEGSSHEMDGSFDGMLGDYQVDFSTLGMA